MPPPSRGGNETESIKIPGRPEQLNKPKPEYENTELEFEFLITDTSKTRKIFAWLKGSGKLVYSDEPDKYYNVISNDVIDAVRVSDELRSFTVRFICSPFAYSVSETPVTYSNLITNADSYETKQEVITVTNNGSIYSEPLYKIKFNGILSVGIGGTVMTIESPGEYTNEYVVHGGASYYKYQTQTMEIYIDTHARLAYQSENGTKEVICDRTKGQYPFLAPGDNAVSFTFSREIGTWTHNVESDGHTLTRTYYCPDQNLNEVTITKKNH